MQPDTAHQQVNMWREWRCESRVCVYFSAGEQERGDLCLNVGVLGW